MPPVKHALLSASSASRWLVCTAAPRFEEGLPESTSEYAEEGRLAHAIGELKVTKKCTPMSTRTYNTRLNKLKKDPLYTPEMDKTTDLYLEHITEQVMAYDTAPTVAVEVQVDFSDYVPEGFGTCDCCIIGGDLLSIVDYPDPTAYNALRPIMQEDAALEGKVNFLIKVLKFIIAESGFELLARIEIKDKKTGRCFR